MGFDFSKKVKTESTSERAAKELLPAYREGCSEQSIVQISIQRSEAMRQGCWEMIFYYYYLEKIMKELQSRQDFNKLYWETHDWKEAQKYLEEPTNVIVGLEELERFCKIHKIKGLEDIKDVIRILPGVVESAK